jgi:uncharacterized protein with FMN-binding domain
MVFIAGGLYMARMGNKLVAMCSIAVGLIYAGAYEVTANQANSATASVSGNIKSTNNIGANTGSNLDHPSITTDSGNTTASIDNTSGNMSNSNNTGSTTNANTSKTPTYKDGTYTGSGSDRRGTVEVSVTIAHGKISKVQITDYEMHYPESYIEGLPQEVVQRQSADVDIVTGATSSSEDFQMAIEQALAAAEQSA